MQKFSLCLAYKQGSFQWLADESNLDKLAEKYSAMSKDKDVATVKQNILDARARMSKTAIATVLCDIVGYADIQANLLNVAKDNPVYKYDEVAGVVLDSLDPKRVFMPFGMSKVSNGNNVLILLSEDDCEAVIHSTGITKLRQDIPLPELLLNIVYLNVDAIVRPAGTDIDGTPTKQPKYEYNWLQSEMQIDFTDEVNAAYKAKLRAMLSAPVGTPAPMLVKRKMHTAAQPQPFNAAVCMQGQHQAALAAFAAAKLANPDITVDTFAVNNTVYFKDDFIRTFDPTFVRQ